MANGITRNEKGKIVRWYNFLVTTDTRKKDCFIDLFKSLNPFSAVLHLDNKDVLDVNYSRFYFENLKSGKIIYDDNFIANFIHQECTKVVGDRDIYVDINAPSTVILSGNLDEFSIVSDIVSESYFVERFLKWLPA